jgi:hypothetical protein
VYCRKFRRIKPNGAGISERQEKAATIFWQNFTKRTYFLTDIYFKYLPTVVLIGFVRSGAGSELQKGYSFNFL